MTFAVLFISLGSIIWILAEEHQNTTILSEQSELNANFIKVYSALLAKVKNQSILNANATELFSDFIDKIKNKLMNQDQSLRDFSQQINHIKGEIQQSSELPKKRSKISSKQRFYIIPA